MRTALSALVLGLAAGPALAQGPFDLSKLRTALEAEQTYAADSLPYGVYQAGAPARRPVSGRVEASIGYTELDDDSIVDVMEYDGVSVGLRGSLNVGSRGLNGQVDGFAQIARLGAAEAESYGGTLHAYYRPEGGNFAAGAFGSLTRSTAQSDALANVAMDETRDVIGGLEAAYLGRNVTAFLRAGYGRASLDVPVVVAVTGTTATQAISPGNLFALSTANGATGRVEVDADRWLLAGGARFFVGDNLRFDLEGSLNRLELGDTHADLYGFETKAVYRKSGSPYSLFAGYRRSHASVDTAGVTFRDGASLNTFFAGARLNFGAQSLREQDRAGALWEDLGPTPLTITGANATPPATSVATAGATAGATATGGTTTTTGTATPTTNPFALPNFNPFAGLFGLI